MTKSKIFLILAVSFLLGIFLASFFEITRTSLLIITVGALTVLVLNRENKKALVVSAALICLMLGIWRCNCFLDGALKKMSEVTLGPESFVAAVVEEPEARDKYQKIVARNESGEKILINADVYPSYDYGDKIKVSCNIQKPKNFSEKFDYQMYLAKDGIFKICRNPEIILLARNRGSRIYDLILSIKDNFEEKLSRIFPEPEGAYLKGLLLGGDKRMPKKLSEAFSKTGTTHTVAVSGFNVTVIAAFLMMAGILLGFWRQQAFWFAVAGIFLFVVMIGFPSSAMRAGIMGSLVLWGMKNGRLANSTNAIVLAAVIMLLFNPLLLRYDIGFQLSFLATLGIIQLYPLLEKFFGKGSSVKVLKETVFLTLAAQIFVMPIILNAFEKLPLVSPIANLLILPAIPYIMLGGFAAGIAGFVFIPLGKLVGFLPFIFLKLEIFAVEGLAKLSWASVEVNNFGWECISGYYFVLFLILYFNNKRSRSLAASAVKKARMHQLVFS